MAGRTSSLAAALATIARTAARLSDAGDVLIFQAEGDQLRLVARHGAIRAIRRIGETVPAASVLYGRAFLDRRTLHVRDLAIAVRNRFKNPEWAALQKKTGVRTLVAIPILRDGAAVGVLVGRRTKVRPFTSDHIALLTGFAAQAATEIENVRLAEEAALAQAQVDESVDRERASAEVLGVISRSPTDPRPVFDALADGARRLCDTDDVTVLLVKDGMFHRAVHLGSIAALDPGEPIPISESSLFGRAVLDRRIQHIADVTALDEAIFPMAHELARRFGIRTVLVVPLIRDGVALGVISLRRRDVRPFTERQVALVDTFAAEAVIAIENVRLFNELDTRNRELVAALEQQTATADILRVISSSPRDLQPVMDAVVRNAARLCGAADAQILRPDGDVLRLVAEVGSTAIPPARPISREYVAGRAFVDGRTLHVHDNLELLSEYPQTSAQAYGTRTLLAAPLMSAGVAIGVIRISRREVLPFTERQVELLQTFADQAVIAIENIRLFRELTDRNRALTESLEQQTATSEILRVISASPTDTQPVFDAIARNAGQLCGAIRTTVNLLDGEWIRIASAAGRSMEGLTPDIHVTNAPNSARVIREGITFHVDDNETDPRVTPEALHRMQSFGARSLVVIPLNPSTPIGSISVYRADPGTFSPQHIALLRTFADQAVIAIENVRLFTELGARNRDLTESLDRQTASAEILRAISQSQTDVTPVFEAIVRNALRFCGATNGGVFRFDGERFHLLADAGFTPEQMAIRRRIFPRAVAGGPNTRAMQTRAVVRVDDITSDSASDILRDLTDSGLRSVLVVPMLRQHEVFGTISVSHREAAAFSDAHVELLQTFADQAVIAIENARLLSELQARTDALTRSVDRMTALGEIGQAVSSSLELETVLSTIVSRAIQLAGASAGTIWEYDDATNEFVLRITENIDGAGWSARQDTRVRRGEGAVGRLAVTHEPVQIPDITAAGAYEGRLRDTLVGAGTRALLAVPLLREGRILGGLVMSRRTPGEFPAEVVDVLKTFATQSALAIQNARLFRELESKGHELEVASRHKSEFVANMSHELRTPLNAIIGYSEMLEEEATDLGQQSFVADLKKINSAGKHLLELINAVLDLSKIEAGRMELYLEDFDVHGLTNDIAVVIHPLAEKNGNRFEVSCAADVGTMRADLTKVRQSLFNLTSNACKFTERGTISLGVRRERRAEGDGLVFDVGDTGIGMTAEQIGRLFEDFAQADAATTRKYGGTGLGLALSRRLCRMMGGDISVVSEFGRGSTFTIRLPAVVEPPAPIAPSVERGPEGGRVVLVIDDEGSVRELLQRTLAKEGFRTVAAATGEEGLRLAREVNPDVITLDVMMPGLDGWAVLGALKADPATADLPVIMVTVVDNRNLAFALGAAEFLTKPIDRDRLVTVLKKYRRDRPVLIVDDDPAIREVLRRVLVAEGYAVVEAENGRRALERLQETPAGVVLLDLMMPELDGFDVVEAMRANQGWRGIPIVVLTAKELTAEDRARLNGHVERILQKGALSRDDLLRQVRDLVTSALADRRGMG